MNNKEHRRGLFLGRFQPYHKGHHETVKRITAHVDELIIGVGSADRNYELENPFTAGERILMIQRSTSNIKIPIYTIPYEDIKNNALFPCNISALVPPFDTVYSNNPLVIQLFKERSIKVQKPALIDRKKYRGSKIRALIVKGEQWKHLVPAPAAAVIEEIRGVERIQNLSQKDIMPGK